MFSSLTIFMIYRSLMGIENQLKNYTRLLTAVEMWSLNVRLKQEYLLKKRREELIYYRKNGIHKIYDTIKFNLLHFSMVIDGMFKIYNTHKIKY